MLFVLGFRATKLRQGRLAELIHQSQEHKPEWCSVHVHFAAIDKVIAIDFDFSMAEWRCGKRVRIFGIAHGAQQQH